jgi:Peptidase family M28
MVGERAPTGLLIVLPNIRSNKPPHTPKTSAIVDSATAIDSFPKVSNLSIIFVLRLNINYRQTHPRRKSMKLSKMQLINRPGLIRLAILGIILLILSIWGYKIMIAMPGNSYNGDLPPLTAKELALRDEMTRDVNKLAGEIGERNYIKYEQLNQAADFIHSSFQAMAYEVKRQTYQVNKQDFSNIEVEIKGKKFPDEIVLVGGHYDSVFASPGANDNATGSAGILALAKLFFGKKPDKTLRFVQFVNEEPPFFFTPNMGSFVYAKRARERQEKIVSMLSVETIGYFSNAKDSQKYPPPLSLFYPSTGNFIGFIGNVDSASLVKHAIASFRKNAKFPSEGASLPDDIPGIG